MSTLNVTPLELKVLTNIVRSEYLDIETIDDAVGHPIWSWSATDETKQLVGALSSCSKKGLVGCSKYGKGQETCYLTQAGADYLESINFQL